MPARRLLVTGGSGYLGREILARSRAGASAFEIHATRFANPLEGVADDRSHVVDLRDENAAANLVESLDPAVILHTAGSNRTPESLESIEPGARALARAARDRGARLIHLSTDLVFDGESPPYREDDSPAPLSPYGEAKARAEDAIREIDPDAVIVRTSLIYGVDPPDHQTRWLLDGVRSGDPVRLFTDERRSPVFVTALADAVLELATSDFSGTLHVAGPESLDRFTFGSAILGWLGIDPVPANVKPATIAESGLVRPKDVTLDVGLARSVLKAPFPTVDEARRTAGEC